MKFINAALITFVLTLVFAAVGLSQTAFKAGDTIYVNAFYSGCVKATVLQTDPPYWVHVEEGSYKGSDTMYSAGRIGECKQAAAAAAAIGDNGGDGVTITPNAGNLQAGARVDVYLSGGKEGKN